MNLKEIKDLIELVDDKGFAEFELKRKGFSLRISRFKESNQQILPPTGAPLIISSTIPGASDLLSPSSHRGLIESRVSPEPTNTPSAQPDADAGPVKPELHIIKSPIVGTFYSAPSPTSEAFVKLGDTVAPETVVCIIEAMKLMNEIQAEVRGEVATVYVEDGQPVEYGQNLFGIKI
jgi:acetyl-CoA carboxylase biotin carboxyl carrier protein